MMTASVPTGNASESELSRTLPSDLSATVSLYPASEFWVVSTTILYAVDGANVSTKLSVFDGVPPTLVNT